MANLSEQGEKQMTNGNGNHDQAQREENKRLKSLLQKAVNAEKAPESLREKISRMIREKQ